ncbi:MAG: hypothetical protein PWP03_168 [Candidatus Woesearchaeota archaeon]|nr:hypothetical protein [Candidatus Woesearchaeota archaeon]
MKKMNGIKKIAAVALGAAMLGATFGAAVDLGDYPAPFVKDGQVNAKIVLGEKAQVIDVLGAVNIAASFSAAGGQGTVLVEEKEGTVVNAVPLEVNDEFPAKGQTATLDFDEDDSEWSHFVGYNNDDITEDLDIKINATEGTDDRPAVDIMEFNYTMDIDSDDLHDAMSDFEDDAQTGDEFKYKIKLFGKEYYVVAKWNGTDYVNGTLQLANVDLYTHTGEEIDLADYGYPGYKLVIENMYESGSNSDEGTVQLSLVKDGVTVDTDEVDEKGSTTLKDGDTKVKVYVNAVYYSAEKSQYTAKISMESGKTNPGEYLDDDEMWNLTSIDLNATADTLNLKVVLDPKNDDWEVEGKKELEGSKVRIYKGVQQSLMGYAAVGFVGLTEQTFGNLKISEPEIGKFVLDLEGLKDVYIDTKKTRATEITFKINETNSSRLYIYGMTGDDKDDFKDVFIDGTKALTFKVGDAKYKLTYDNSTPKFDLATDVDADNTYEETLSVELDGSGDSDFYWDAGYVNGTSEKYEAGQSTDGGVKIVEYDERAREVEFALPDDIVRYKVYAGKDVTGEQKETLTYKVGDTITEGGVIKAVGGAPLPVGLAILDTELPSADAVKNGNYVVVGGPCVNTAAAALLGNPEDCAAGFEPGKAVIQLFENNDNYALLVAGYNGEDTLLATEVLGNYKDFAEKFAGKDKVTISGTKVSDVTLE